MSIVKELGNRHDLITDELLNQINDSNLGKINLEEVDFMINPAEKHLTHVLTYRMMSDTQMQKVMSSPKIQKYHPLHWKGDGDKVKGMVKSNQIKASNIIVVFHDPTILDYDLVAEWKKTTDKPINSSWTDTELTANLTAEKESIKNLEKQKADLVKAKAAALKKKTPNKKRP